MTTFKTLPLPSGIKMHYASAGSESHPPLLLLHGVPASNHQFRNLIPLLAHKYRVLAPDLPGFGHTTVPNSYTHGFEGMAAATGEFLDALKITKCAVYVFDYGAPTAWRLALKCPELFTAVVTQNGNAYESGFGAGFWDPIMAWWAGKDFNGPMHDVIEGVVGDKKWTRSQYYEGVPEAHHERVDPKAYELDYALCLEKPEQVAVQMQIMWDYRTNVPLYPKVHEWFAKSQIPLLAVWGKGDPCFIHPGAGAFKEHLPKARVELLDGGHFLLETQLDKVAELMLDFLKGVKW